jgi:hypothetical protein
LLPLFFFVSFFPPFYTSFHYVISPYSSPKGRSTQHGIQCREACVPGGTLAKTESFAITQRDYSHRTGCPAPAESVTWKFVKQFKQRGNANVPKRVPAVVTEISTYATRRCTLSELLVTRYNYE